MENRFEERYRTGDIPWDHGMPEANLIDVVAQRPIPRCKALDVGCGTGENAIWLARQEFMATGCDFSRTAIGMAKKKAGLSKAACSFLVADFMKDRIPGLPFGFVFDRGCLHCIDTAGELVVAVEPHFEIVSLAAGHFGSDQPDPPKAWVCLMQKRKIEDEGR